ncbi:hypothetical protein GY45DRAFT_1357711, partial [Cubamyces sp. BRFM 1775]
CSRGPFSLFLLSSPFFLLSSSFPFESRSRPSLRLQLSRYPHPLSSPQFSPQSHPPSGPHLRGTTATIRRLLCSASPGLAGKTSTPGFVLARHDGTIPRVALVPPTAPKLWIKR